MPEPAVLPPLRRNLDLMPSPLQDRPGLLIRDPFRYSDAMVVIPPPLVRWLLFFDGQRSELDLREALVRATGDVRAGGLTSGLVTALSQGGFLDDEVFAGLKQAKEGAFATALRREPVHAGAAYPTEPDALTETLCRYLDGTHDPLRPASTETAALPGMGGLVAIAAPHVSPEGGWRAYQAAYTVLRPEHRDRTFVILGTSHYGAPERFGLTRKPFATPFGAAPVDLEVVDRLAGKGGPAVDMEDYCHSVEHSIEFQVVFLQHLYGPDVRIVPILCGPFAESTRAGGRPEDDEGVGRFLEALAELAQDAPRLVFVLGVDMAHVGRRYGDAFSARAHEGAMGAVEERDRRRIGRLLEGDAAGFWADVQEDSDPLRWCGSSPLYAFLKAVPSRGELLRYEQWNIDDRSVVSFAGMAFRRPA